MASPAPRTFEVVTADGARLDVEHIPAAPDAGAPRGAVWCAHAILANRKSLDRPRGAGLGSTLAARGLEVYLASLRGHGQSLRASPQTRDWSYHDLVRYDLPALTGFVRARHPDLGVAGLGHSLAGHASLAWLGLAGDRDGERAERGDRAGGARAAAPLDALVTVAANIWMRALEPSLLVWLRKRATLAALDLAARALGRLPAARVGAGSDDVSARFAGELHGFARAGAWRSPEGIDYFAGTARVAVPVLAVLGAGDALLCREVSGRRFHARLPRCEVRLYGERECGFAPGHMELVTDPRARPVWEDVGDWLGGVLGAARRATGPREAAPPGRLA